VKKNAESGIKRLTPKKAIQAYCIHCVGGSIHDVKACDADDPAYHVCPFHPYRQGKGRPSAKIIRIFCLDCMGGSKDFVRDCETTDCLCHPYRLGKNPHKIKTGRTADEMKKIRALRSGIAKGFAGEFERSPAEPALPPHLGESIKTNPEIQCKIAAGDEIDGKVLDVSVATRNNRQQSAFSFEWAKE